LWLAAAVLAALSQETRFVEALAAATLLRSALSARVAAAVGRRTTPLYQAALVAALRGTTHQLVELPAKEIPAVTAAATFLATDLLGALAAVAAERPEVAEARAVPLEVTAALALAVHCARAQRNTTAVAAAAGLVALAALGALVAAAVQLPAAVRLPVQQTPEAAAQVALLLAVLKVLLVVLVSS